MYHIFVKIYEVIKSTVLITGGAGFIGSHVNKLLAQKGYPTVVFDDLSTGHRGFVKWGEFFRGDLGKSADIERCLSKYKVNAVMHFAASTAVGESVSEPAKYYANNVVNTLNLLDALKTFRVKNFIFSSSAAVYGIPLKTPITENHVLAPINPYGRTKKMAEALLPDYAAAYGLKYAAFRYFNAAGADPDGELGQWYDSFSHLIPLVLDAAAGRQRALRVFGTDYDTPDGTCVRDYVHVSDLASAHVLALEYLLRGGDSAVFNLGNGRGYSVLDVILTAEKITGRKIKVIRTGRRSGDAPVSVASSSRAERTLKWKRKYARLEDIIGTAWNWHKKMAGRGQSAPVK